MIFLGIALIVSAAIIAATFIYLFTAGMNLYKEILNGLFEKDDDPVVETPDNNNTPEIKFGGF